ncbi:MAG TPA: GSCFA domain-containing protein, partial [Chitinophagaceae bacterium]|nr:GSCFA domain-containing protein [Chitinophagaceae bacterium]
PASVCRSLISYTEEKEFTASALFQLNELWQSWQHHSRFSNTDPAIALGEMNAAHRQARAFLRDADWIVITLGSSFSYRLSGAAEGEAGMGVANCHRAPAQWFTKHLLRIDETVALLDECYHRLMQFNPKLNIIFTVSPVRHIRDGVVENNRSKARLLEAVHHMVNKFDRLSYFPAYELVIDVLRDYRFYDVDLVHPNYMATEFVLEQFALSCIDPASRELMQEIKKIVIARKHKPFQPDTEAHRQFLSTHFEKTRMLREKYPLLDWTKEINYFTAG